MFTDPGKTPWVLLAAVLMQQAEGYLLVPRIMDKSVGVHPLVTLLAIAAFGSVFGLAGAILAIPLAAIIQVLLNRYLLGPAAAEPQQPCGRGTLSVLHYDVQQLLRDIRLRDKAERSAESIDHYRRSDRSDRPGLGRGVATGRRSSRGGGRAMTRLAKVTAAVVATLLGLAALWEFRDPALIFLLSLVVAAAARAPVDYLAGRGLPKSVALAGVYVVSVLVVAGLVLAAIYLVSGELGRATDDFKRLYEYAAGHSSAVLWIERTVGERLPPADELLTALVGRHGEQAVRLVLGTAFGVVSAVVDVVFVIVLSIYWAIDRAYFERLWLSLLPLPQRVSARELWQMLESELGAYVRSETRPKSLGRSRAGGRLLSAGAELSRPVGGGRRFELVASLAGRDHRVGGAGRGRTAGSGPQLARLALFRCHGGFLHGAGVRDPRVRRGTADVQSAAVQFALHRAGRDCPGRNFRNSGFAAWPHGRRGDPSHAGARRAEAGRRAPSGHRFGCPRRAPRRAAGRHGPR